MRKEIFEKFEEMQEKEQIIDFVDTKLKEVFLESVLNGSLSGWRYDVLLSEDGLSVRGPLSQGTITMEQYTRKALVLASIDASIEIDETIVDLYSLDEEDKEELIELIMDSEDLETEQEVYDNIYNINVDGYFQEINREKYDEMIKDHAEYQWETYFRDGLIDEIFQNFYEIREIETAEEE